MLDAYISPRPASTTVASVTRFDRTLGKLDAVEIWDPRRSAIVRAVVPSNDEAYAVLLYVDGPTVYEKAYGVFDLTCRSAEFRNLAP